MSEVEQTLAELAGPLKEQLHALEQEIEADQAVLEEKRKLRTRIAGVLRGLDPHFAAEQQPKTKSKRQKSIAFGNYNISEEKIELVLDYIRSHHGNGQPFYGKQLPLSELGMSDPTRNAALRRLQERGLLRLDHVGSVPGQSRSNRANWYALTAKED